MTAYINCSKSGNKKYLQVVEATYVKRPDGSSTIKRKVLKNLGALEKWDDGKPDFLERLRTQFKNGELHIDGLDEVYSPTSNPSTIVVDKRYSYMEPKNLGYFFLNSVFDQLGIAEILTLEKSRSKIRYDLVGLTRLMVYGRILTPDSKIATLKQKDNYLFPVTECEDEKEIYRALDMLSKCCDKVQKRMNLRISQSQIGRLTDITYYDVTNYYFETMYNDEDIAILDEDGNIVSHKQALRKKGVSKEHRPQPIVQMGLFMDHNGIPVSFQLFPGNTQDKTTFKNVIKDKINEYELGKVIVVADNGMYAQENFYLLLSAGNGYILSKSLKRGWKSNRDIALDDNGYTVQKNKYGEVVFKYKSIITEKIAKDKEGHSIKYKEKMIIYWSKKQYQKMLHDNEKFLEYLESCKEHPDKLKDKQRKSQEFIKKVQIDKKTGEIVDTKEVVVFLEEKIQKYKEMMGYYSIVTSEVNMDEREIINKYHGLSRIEDSFRVVKDTLEGRPIYVRTNEHIQAHFLICFIALTIIRIWQYKVLKHHGKDTLNEDGWETGISAEKFAKSLKEFCADRISDEYYKVSRPNEDIQLLLDIVGSSIDLQFPKEKILRKLKTEITKFKF